MIEKIKIGQRNLKKKMQTTSEMGESAGRCGDSSSGCGIPLLNFDIDSYALIILDDGDDSLKFFNSDIII